MATKKNTPGTRAGIDKRIAEIQKSGVTTLGLGLELCELNLKSIELEMQALDSYKEHPMAAELKARYEPIKLHWEQRLKHIQERMEE